MEEEADILLIKDNGQNYVCYYEDSSDDDDNLYDDEDFSDNASEARLALVDNSTGEIIRMFDFDNNGAEDLGDEFLNGSWRENNVDEDLGDKFSDGPWRDMNEAEIGSPHCPCDLPDSLNDIDLIEPTIEDFNIADILKDEECNPLTVSNEDFQQIVGGEDLDVSINSVLNNEDMINVNTSDTQDFDIVNEFDMALFDD